MKRLGSRHWLAEKLQTASGKETAAFVGVNLALLSSSVHFEESKDFAVSEVGFLVAYAGVA